MLQVVHQPGRFPLHVRQLEAKEPVRVGGLQLDLIVWARGRLDDA